MKPRVFIFVLIILCFLLPSVVYAQESQIPFNDHLNHTYQEAIEYLFEEGIIQGYPDSTFKPDNRVSRAELLKIIIASNYDVNDYDSFGENSCFPDVNEGNWYTQYICFAKSRGIVQGYPDGTFKPEQDINLVEGLKIIFEGMNLAVDDPNAFFKFKYYSPAMRRGYLPEELKGGYEELITRGETSEIIYQILIDPNKILREDIQLGLKVAKQGHLASCGIASLSIGLSNIQDVDSQQIIDKMISFNMYPNRPVENIDGIYYWDDPQEVFVGNMDGIVSKFMSRIGGFGFLETPLERLAKEWAPNSFKFHDESVIFIAEQLLDGNPVIAFVNVNALDGRVIINEPSPFVSNWRTHEGKIISAPMYKHNLVVEGFRGIASNPELFYIVDPFYGQKITLTKSEFESILVGFEYTGVVIKF